MKRKFFGLSLSVALIVSMVVLSLPGQTVAQNRGSNEYIPNPSVVPSKTHTIMRPDMDTIKRWHERSQKNERARIDERFHKRVAPGVQAVSAAAGGFTSANILGNLTYSVSENQGSCGNCFAWAAHRVMGVDLKRQKSIGKNLSIQYFNACDDSGAPCCGGFLSDVTDFYSRTKKAVPNSNSNAGWKDGSRTGCSSSVSCSSVSTSTNYPISSISPVTITTTGVSQAQAIANIKNVINQGKAVWFAFYLPTSSAWNNYNSFWSSSSESTLWNSDNYCGNWWSYYGGGGHGVTIVGYDDSSSSTSNHYWIVLNSWGTTSKRSKGLYRHKMYVNYGCTFYGMSGYALNFQTANISWNISSSSSSSTSSSSTSSTSSSSTSSSSTSTSSSSTSSTSSSSTSGWWLSSSSTSSSSSSGWWSSSSSTSSSSSSGWWLWSPSPSKSR